MYNNRNVAFGHWDVMVVIGSCSSVFLVYVSLYPQINVRQSLVLPSTLQTCQAAVCFNQR